MCIGHSPLPLRSLCVKTRHVTWTNQCHSRKLLLPVLHDSKPYLRLPRLQEDTISPICSRQKSTSPPKPWFNRHTLSRDLQPSRDLCSSTNRNEMSSSHQTIVSLQWFVCFLCPTSGKHSMCPLFMFRIIPSRNLPIFVYHGFLFKTFSPNLSYKKSVFLDQRLPLFMTFFVISCALPPIFANI